MAYRQLIVHKVFDQPREMISRLFRTHGQFCASRPWEVIVVTITLVVCAMSMSLFAATDRGICGWNIKCIANTDIKIADIMVLTLTKTLAVIYIYLQFRKLRKLGSKYLLGLAGVFSIISSFVFSIAVINLMGSDLTGLNEAGPFFLLLVDLSQACALARFALSSKSQDEVADNIGRGMAIIGPSVTLDAVVSTLVIGVGTLSGVRQLETMCCFGCLSVVANYVAFMTFYPACLSLVLELSRERLVGRPLPVETQQLIKVIEETGDKPNPVNQRVKVIMSVGLVMVHVHSRLLTVMSGGDEDGRHTGPLSSQRHLSDFVNPDTPLWRFFLYKASSPGIDNIVPLVLGICLALKYIFLDGYLEKELHTPSLLKNENSDPREDFPITQAETNYSYAAKEHPKPDETAEVVEEPPKLTTHFSIGDSSDESDSEEVEGAQEPLSVSRLSAVSAESQSTQTDWSREGLYDGPPRPVEKCTELLRSEDGLGAAQLTDEEVLILVKTKKIKAYQLEKALADYERGVHIRRRLVFDGLEDPDVIQKLPYQNYDYSKVDGACCENVIGYMPVPVGFAGPLLLDDKRFTIPMATTEGCLVASTNRGCQALTQSGGVHSVVLCEGMTRAPVVRFPSAARAGAAKLWMEHPDNTALIAEAFNSTSRFARLEKVKIAQASRFLYIRFTAFTGDAMGMNMLSKGSERALTYIQDNHFPDMEIISLSGNYCTDKKPAAINWLEGRGRSVVCEAVVPAHVIQTVLKTTVHALVELNISKNYIGSAMAGSIGGFNAHAANIVTAIYIATGQDPAQNVNSSNCLTVMEAQGEDLYISVTMPSLELGTVGGGTVLPPQAACLEMLGVRGSCPAEPGAHARQLARVVCGAVLAGELSLMSALAAGHLVKSHLKHNRSSINMAAEFARASFDSPRLSLKGSPERDLLTQRQRMRPLAASTPDITVTSHTGRRHLVTGAASSGEPGTCTSTAS